jgi:pimeloyl-ACP methyl ester carboxylesterase
MAEGTIRLADGRVIAYGVYGNPRGVPVYHFHGTPGSRLEAALVCEKLQREDACFIGIDRPGYGHSSMKRNGQIADFPSDVAAVADHLGHRRFIAAGYSGGGPFAVACAARIPERLAAVGILSGVGPCDIGSEGMHESNRKKFNLAQRLPWVVKLMIRAGFAGMRGRPQRLRPQLQKVWAQMPAPDQQALQDPVFVDWMIKETLDAIELTTAGFAHEEVLMAFPWRIDLRAIRCENVFLWHGCEDRNVPVAMGRAVAEQIPGCRAEFLEGEGHLSLIYNRGQEIFGRLIEVGKKGIESRE